MEPPLRSQEVIPKLQWGSTTHDWIQVTVGVTQERSSVGEQCLYTATVGGSNPFAPIHEVTMRNVEQLSKDLESVISICYPHLQIRSPTGHSISIYKNQVTLINIYRSSQPDQWHIRTLACPQALSIQVYDHEVETEVLQVIDQARSTAKKYIDIWF